MQVDEVKNIMVDNIEKVLERGEKIELLVDKTDNLRFQVHPDPVISPARQGLISSCETPSHYSELAWPLQPTICPYYVMMHSSWRLYSQPLFFLLGWH